MPTTVVVDSLGLQALATACRRGSLDSAATAAEALADLQAAVSDELPRVVALQAAVSTALDGLRELNADSMRPLLAAGVLFEGRVDVLLDYADRLRVWLPAVDPGAVDEFLSDLSHALGAAQEIVEQEEETGSPAAVGDAVLLELADDLERTSRSMSRVIRR